MKTYALSACIITYGYVPLSGFGQNEAWAPEPIGERFTSVDGVDGSYAMSYTGARRWKVMISLLQTSEHNATLTGFHEADLISAEKGGGGIVFPLAFKDPNGLDLFLAAEARIMTPPSWKRSNKIEDQSWVLETGAAKCYLGRLGVDK